MRQRKPGITPTDDTVTVLIDLSDIGNINRKRLQELRNIDTALSRSSVLAFREEDILERMVEIVIYNLRRRRDRLPFPDEVLENNAFKRNLDNERVFNGQHSTRAKIIYTLVETKVKMALSGFWEYLYEPLEMTQIFPKAISKDAVLVVISRASQSEEATEEKFRHLTSIGSLAKKYCR